MGMIGVVRRPDFVSSIVSLEGYRSRAAFPFNLESFRLEIVGTTGIMSPTLREGTFRWRSGCFLMYFFLPART